jgi:hypothetical protein
MGFICPMKRQKVILLILIVLFGGITLSCIYHLQGGYDPWFNKPAVYQVGEKTRYMVGSRFDGKGDEKKLSALHVKYHDWVAADQDTARWLFMAVVNYPVESNKDVSQFIGVVPATKLRKGMQWNGEVLPKSVIIAGTSAEIPMGEDLLEVACRRRYQLNLVMPWYLRPKPHRVERLIREEAKRNGDEIDYFFEVYYRDGSMTVEGWVE